MGERDDILVCLGRTTGRFSAVVKGSRAGKSRLSGLLEPPVELEGALRFGNSLDRLSQLRLSRAFAGLRASLEALLTAGFLARLTLECLPERSEAYGVYQLFGALLDRLSRGENVALTALLGQDRLLRELGVEPMVDCCVHCEAVDVQGFSASDGGMVCRRCYQGRGFAVSAAGLAALRSVRASDHDDLLLSAEQIREVGRIHKHQFQEHLGLPNHVFRAVLPTRARPGERP